MTSRDVVNVVQRRLGRKTKVGHAGTLDPLAEGVLVLGVGPAVRLVPYVQQQPKHYRATFRLGVSTVSGDLDGEVTEHGDLPAPSRERIEAAASELVGQIEQTPPAHSAIHVDGKRAYERIRAGEEFDMPSRMVQIHSLVVRRYQFPELDVDIVCGSGTYIRTLGIDLAKAAGSIALMSHLCRIAVGPFHVGESVSIDELRDGDLDSMLLPPSLGAGHMSSIVIGEADSERLGHGLCIDGAKDESATEAAAVTPQGELRAIVRRKADRWCPHRVFPTKES